MMWQNQHFDSGLGDFVSCHPVSQPVLASGNSSSYASFGSYKISVLSRVQNNENHNILLLLFILKYKVGGFGHRPTSPLLLPEHI
ncbi:hypothetical protein Hanom_Chr03g00250371 [Helianthus anomalus]